MKKRILSFLLLCCMVLTLLPTAALAEAGKTRSGAVRPAATEYTYTLHYDANGGIGAPPSQSVTSSEFHVKVPISNIIPTRDGYDFMGWANSRTGTPLYHCKEGYHQECLVVHGYDMSTTIYAIWEVHNHRWGEWTSNGNGTHTRTCATDSSHTETANCSGGTATATEQAICETCGTGYGELLQLTQTVITTPPTLPAEGYVGNEYMDEALQGGEAKAEGTGVPVPGSFRFKNNGGGRIARPGENRMEVLFVPNEAGVYTTAECIVTVTGIKRTITRVPKDVVITDKPLGTAFEDLGLPVRPYGVMVETNTGTSFSPIPVTWDGSTYNPNIYGEQIITGELHVEQSRYTDKLEPTSTVRATARITLIDDRVFTPTLEPPTYSKQLYGGDLCFVVFANEYLSGGVATANGEEVSGKFKLDEDQKIYGHSLTASTLLQAGPLQLKVIFTPNNPLRYTKAECTIDVNVIPRTFQEATVGYITDKKIGTLFEELGLSDSFSFNAVGDVNDPNGTGSGYDMPVVTSWDSSTYDPHSFEEQTIYGAVDRTVLEKYFTIPEGADLRAVRKVQLQPDPVETEVTQAPVFQWKNGDFTLPENTIFTWRKLQVGTDNAEVGTLIGGVATAKGSDTVAPGRFSFKNAPPFYLKTPGEHEVTVVFTPDDTRLYKPTETTIKINAIKNTIQDTDEPDPITDKPVGTTFAALGLPEDVVINGVDGAWRWVDVAWEESSYDAESLEWQTITGTLVLDEDAQDFFQQPEPAVTAAIRVKLVEKEEPSVEELVDPIIRIIPDRNGGYYAQQGTRTAADFFKPGEVPKGAKITNITPPASPSILNSIRIDNDGTLHYAKNAAGSGGLATDVYTVTITRDDDEPISAPLTVRQYIFAGFRGAWDLSSWTYGDTRTYNWKVLNPGENGTWSAIMQEPGIFEIYEETVDTTSEPGVSHYTMKVRAIKAGNTYIDILYVSDTTAAWSPWSSSTVVAGGKVFVRGLTVTAGSATITKGDALPTDLVTCIGLLESEGRTDDRDTVLENALSYRLLDANNQEVTADTAQNTPGTYTVVPIAALKPGWDERYSLNRVNGMLTVEDKVVEEFTITFDGNGGTPAVDSMTTTDQKLASLPDASRRNYRFDGWYTETGGGAMITTDTVFPDHTTVYAHWTYTGSSYNVPVASYTLRFETGGGSDMTNVRGTYNTYIDLTQYVPTRHGYTFVGWYSDRDLTEPVSDVYLTQDRTVYAGWHREEAPGPDANPFADVSEKDWFYGDVLFVYENGWMLGTSKTLFSPLGTVMRGMMATVLWRMEDSPAPTGKSSFTDVEAEMWYADAIAWTAENDIFVGYDKDRFGPETPISREQLAAILYRYAGYQGYDTAGKGNLDKFKDADKITDYATTAMQWAVGNGLIKGKSDELLDPQGTATRREIAAILHRFFEKYERM